MKMYKVSIIPMRDQSNSHFKNIRKPRKKIFKDINKAIDYFRECKEMSMKMCFDVSFEEIIKR